MPKLLLTKEHRSGYRNFDITGTPVFKPQYERATETRFHRCLKCKRRAVLYRNLATNRILCEQCNGIIDSNYLTNYHECQLRKDNIPITYFLTALIRTCQVQADINTNEKIEDQAPILSKGLYDKYNRKPKNRSQRTTER